MAAGNTLINVVRFTNIAAGGSSTVAHGLQVDRVAIKPDLVLKSNGDFAIVSTTTTQITVRNDGSATADCDVWCEYKHSMLRSFTPPATTLTPNPFISAGGNTGVSSSNVITWSLTKTWAQVYTEITSRGTEPIICLVEWDPAGHRVMTNNGTVPTQLWNVLFMGLGSNTWLANDAPQAVFIDVDDGFKLAVDPDTLTAILMSQNIDWTFNSSNQITALDDQIYLQCNGGGINGNGVDYLCETHTCNFNLSNGARFNAQVRLTGNASIITATTNSLINTATFVTTTGAKQVDVQIDLTVSINPLAFGVGVTALFTPLSPDVSLFSPDNTRWLLQVDNAGVLSAVPAVP